ncbi:hypothetical protein [Sediminicoccus sp. KRV36]|uniref:hypothetical protein n=1 Tax=Sediminicoccus sp. KRV36 TaxID=3133721 RepID=UPI00200FD0AC|nr:hypothetical protein [Sediminicoccus rosea]UPY35500.1 hypothetical protein LHU95_14875 [Sediminicoccus rosea]
MSLPDAVPRMLARNGRPMALRRRTGTALSTFTETAVTGFVVAFNPSEIIGLIQQGDSRATIGADVGTLTAPAANDLLQVDGTAWRVMGSHPLVVGSTVVGYRLWLRGGAK